MRKIDNYQKNSILTAPKKNTKYNPPKKQLMSNNKLKRDLIKTKE